MHLDRIRTYLFSHLTGKELGHGGFFEARLAGIFERCGVVNQGARRFDLRGHISELELHRLVLKNWLAKALSLFTVDQRRFKSCTRHA